MTNEVEVYYNNHKKCFSVKRANGNLLFHATGVILERPTLKVNWKGASRVLRLRRKEVFARIRGHYWASSDEGSGAEGTEVMGRFYRYFTGSEHGYRVVNAKVKPSLGFYDTLTDFPLTRSGVDPVWALLYLRKDTGSPRILLDYDDNAEELYEDQKDYLWRQGMAIDCKDTWDHSDYVWRRSLREAAWRNNNRTEMLKGTD